MRTGVVVLGALALLAGGTGIGCSADTGLIGHWKLQGDCKDYSGNGNHGTNHGADLSGDAAGFDGRGAYIEAADSRSLRLGSGDFSISAWVKCADVGARVYGDIVNKYDPVSRKGINLHVSSSAPGYSSVSDSRNLQFGIDNGVEGSWEDCGRPWPSNPLVSTLVVYKGHLYTGTADASDPKDACHVFRYDGGQRWTDCGRVGNDLQTPSIYSIAVHNGALYAGTGAWDWERAWEGKTGPCHVYRYEGGTKWHDCGQFGTGFRVMSLASYKGDLYAADDHQAIYRHDGDGNWTACGRIDAGTKLHSMMVYRDSLYGASNMTIHRFDGKSQWPIVGQFDPLSINQIHTFAVHDGNLYAGTWPDGKVLRYDSDNNWADCGWLGVDETFPVGEGKSRPNEVNELTTYNGKLYAGVIPKSQVWRYESGQKWTLVKELVANPAYSAQALPTWMRVPCMTIFQGRLYCGTSTCQARTANTDFSTDAGKVFAWEAGKSASYDDDLGTSWRHIAAVRSGGHLKLYVDGRLVGTSTAFDPKAFDLSNSRPLLIGFGAENYFSGSIRDVRLYNRALTVGDVGELVNAR